ncbi:unnamed protein product [Blepharisma stoltei]|uniref:Uncharacterized protein n=1 Tax=Blepharisma stoltei TaxID=1481888 RepID=A0AAU9KCI1_9CILI|nr:unnamed protein product [Blepharisma stoltei]
MNFKTPIATLLLVNFWILGIYEYFFNPRVFVIEYEDAPKQPWALTEPWKNYLSTLELKIKHQNIVNDNNYCEYVMNYQQDHLITLDQDGLPIKQQRIIFSDFNNNTFPKKILNRISTLSMTEHFTRMNPERHPYEKLKPNINLFFHHEPLWHEFHEIGKHFLCQGQRYNHIPGNENINYKDTTINTFRNYTKHYVGRMQCFNPWMVMPYSLDLSDENQCKEFFNRLNDDKDREGVNWVVKKSRYSHNGQGIQLIDSKTAHLALKEYDYGNKCNEAAGFLAQKYIKYPFLINGKKFDFRAYMFIASMDPLIILYHDGFARITLDDYNSTSGDRSKHLTNLDVAQGFLESKNVTGKEKEEALIDQGWSYQHLEEYLIENNLVKKGWMDSYLRASIKRAMFHIVRMNLSKLLKHPGVFEIMGFDFILDQNLHLWFLEANLTPCITEKNEMKKELNTKFIKDVVDLEYALLYGADFNKIFSRTNFQWIYDGRKKGMDRYHDLITKDCL